MVRFNIIGYGFLEMADPTGVAFKTENHQFRFCDVSLGRTVEFSVPATDRNRAMLGYGEDPAETGEMLRRNYPCQLVYDGGMKMGTIAVTGFEGDTFRCVFTIGNAEWIETLQNKKLSECIVTESKGVVWDTAAPTYDANTADPTQLALIVRYENGVGSMSHWHLVPSLSVRTYIENVFSNLGIPLLCNIPSIYWLITASMKGGTADLVTLDQISNAAFLISQTQNYVNIVDINIEWGTAVVFGAIVGGGSTPSKGFKANQDLKITFHNTLPANLYLIRWNRRLIRCKTLGCTHTDPYGELDNINGMTLDIKKGDIFFFADRGAPDVWQGILPYYGFKSSDVASLSFTATIERNGDLNYGETWFVRNNHPDMTVFEFLKSIALATGMELSIDSENGIVINKGMYGYSSDDFKPLERVISVDSVSRRVRCWGDGTRKATIAFDSEQYVTEPIRSTFEIMNDQLKEEKDEKIGWSEGSVGTYGILVRDVEAGPKFVAKKWTLARADANSAYLQRVEVPSPVGYYDIASNSTALDVRIAAEVADFFALDPKCVYTWRGVAYVWTDASWSDGIMTLTLQRVSELNQDDNNTPPVELVSINAQFNQGGAVVVGTDSLDTLKQYLTVTAIYSDSSERVLDADKYTLSGTLAYPSATVTVDYQGETDTFTVAVAYDAEVEYLQSSGTQHIDLGITALSNEVINIDFKLENADSATTRGIFGSRTSTTEKKCIFFRNSANRWSSAMGSASNYQFAGMYDMNRHTVTMNTGNGNVAMDNGTAHNVGPFTTNEVNLTVFTVNTNGTLMSKASMNLYSLKIGSRLDLIPVRCGTTGYMYDRVSGTLFGNDGTGDFIVGADV